MTNCTSNPIRFKGVKGRKVEAIFSGQTITSDGGGVLLRAADEAIRLLSRIGRCFTDVRRKASCEHSVENLLRQRQFLNFSNKVYRIHGFIIRQGFVCEPIVRRSMKRSIKNTKMFRVNYCSSSGIFGFFEQRKPLVGFNICEGKQEVFILHIFEGVHDSSKVSKIPLHCSSSGKLSCYAIKQPIKWSKTLEGEQINCMKVIPPKKCSV